MRNSDLDRGNDRAATRGIAGLVCGRWSKWAVFALWIAVVAVAGPLSGKLNGAQENDASAWLPKDAESTEGHRAGQAVHAERHPPGSGGL